MADVLYCINWLFSNSKKLNIKGRLGDFPALNIKKTFLGLNIIQIESEMNYINYNGLLKFTESVTSISKLVIVLLVNV